MNFCEDSLKVGNSFPRLVLLFLKNKNLKKIAQESKGLLYREMTTPESGLPASKGNLGRSEFYSKQVLPREPWGRKSIVSIVEVTELLVLSSNVNFHSIPFCT